MHSFVGGIRMSQMIIIFEDSDCELLIDLEAMKGFKVFHNER